MFLSSCHLPCPHWALPRHAHTLSIASTCKWYNLCHTSSLTFVTTPLMSHRYTSKHWHHAVTQVIIKMSQRWRRRLCFHNVTTLMLPILLLQRWLSRFLHFQRHLKHQSSSASLLCLARKDKQHPGLFRDHVCLHCCIFIWECACAFSWTSACFQ